MSVCAMPSVMAAWCLLLRTSSGIWMKMASCVRSFTALTTIARGGWAQLRLAASSEAHFSQKQACTKQRELTSWCSPATTGSLQQQGIYSATHRHEAFACVTPCLCRALRS